MPRRPRIASLVIAAAVGALAIGPLAVPSVAAPVPDPYYPADGNPGYDVRHYAIHDRYRFGDRHLAGVTTVRLVPHTQLATFRLDLLLDVDAVTVDGTPAGFEKTDAHELAVTPASPLAAGQAVDVQVRYHGFPGQISWDGEDNWLASDREVVTMNEPHMAAWWFPSNDHPSDKAAYDIRITTAKGKDVISNGVRLGRTVHGEKATTHWRMTQPMATYLAYFAAGDFAIERGRSHGMRYYNAVSKALGTYGQQQGLRVLGKSAAITAWLQGELGDYPFATTGGLVTSLSVDFALENQSRPTYPAYVGASTVVHELSHQWFGDSVSVERWRDIWLNEGFATYMEWRYREAHGGASTSRHLHSTYAYWRDSPGFWRVDVDDPCSSSTPCPFYRLFGDPVYERGAMTLAALRNRIGASDFHRLLRRWAAAHEGGNVTSGEFRRLAHRISGQHLTAFFDAWLSGDRPPPKRPRYGL